MSRNSPTKRPFRAEILCHKMAGGKTNEAVLMENGCGYGDATVSFGATFSSDAL